MSIKKLVKPFTKSSLLEMSGPYSKEIDVKFRNTKATLLTNTANNTLKVSCALV